MNSPSSKPSEQQDEQFDSLLAGMQRASSKQAMQAAFNAPPAKLGQGAVEAAMKLRGARPGKLKS